MKTRTKFAGLKSKEGVVRDSVLTPVYDLEIFGEEDELLAETVRLAREPLVLEDEEPGVGHPAPDSLRASGGDVSDETMGAAFTAITSTHQVATTAIRELLAAAERKRDNSADELVAAALSTLDKFAQRPDPASPDIHVHTPQHDLHVTVEQPEFKPEITVEGAEITVPEREVKVDVHVPEQPAPQVTVAAATPEINVQPGPAPVVNVTMPDEIRTVPAEVETVAERDADDLIVRSVTRPTGE